jgi:DNA modification methylase
MDTNDGPNGPAAKVFKADARKMPVRTSSIDLVLTSPPYLNAIDYIRCSKFSLVWMGHSVQSLGALRARSVGTEHGEGGKYYTEEVEAILKRVRLLGKLNSRGRAILARYIHDMKVAMAEVMRVLVRGGKAVYVIGENTVRGAYIRTAEILIAIAKTVGLRFVDKRSRALPANRRYLPPPKTGGKDTINLRMRREVIIRFRKPASV